MEYFLIKGHFHVVGYAPDGDSIMFEAHNVNQWKKVPTQYETIFKEKLQDGNGSVQLRLQGIDALETHYGPSMLPPPKELRHRSSPKADKPSPGNYRQPDIYGDLATKKLLSYLNIKDINWGSAFGRKWIKKIEVVNGNDKATYKEKGTDQLEGYIVVNDVDRKGRPISWVFPGKTTQKDGVKFDNQDLLDIIKESVNYKLVANGLAYPYFYMTLSAVLRQPLIYGVLNAQRQKMNLWSEDETIQGINIQHFSQLTSEVIIFPYLFRRIVKHQYRRQMEGYWNALQKNSPFKPDPENLFLDSFFEDTNPYLLLVEERDFVRLNEVVRIDNQQLQLTTHPGNIVFLS